MIHSVTVTNYRNETFEFELRKPDKYGVIITDISGVDAVKGTIYVQDMASSDGSLYTSSKANKRNIVITAQLEEYNGSVEETRHLLYRAFPVKRKVTLLFKTEKRECVIDGYVETNEANIFENPVKDQISIICPYSYFYSAGKNGQQITYFYGIEPTFEFPFSNESLEENLIEFGIITSKKENTVLYDGDADVGVILRLGATGPAKNITIYNVTSRESMFIDTDKVEKKTGHGVIAGDEIIISTVKNEKSVTLLRDGVYTNILNCLGKNPGWLSLTYGDNVFTFDAETGGENLQFRISNSVLYEGL